MAPDVGRTLEANPGYGKSPDPSQNAFMTDLGTLAATIGVEALDVSDPADAVQRALNDLVVHKVSGPAAAHFSGLSIYFPPSLDYLDVSYQDIPDNANVWLEFLDAYFVTGAAIPSTELPAFTSEDSEITLSDDGLDMTNAVEPASVDNLSGATIRYGVENEDGSTTFFGDETAELADDGSGLVTGFYDLTVLHDPTAPAGGPVGSSMVTSWWAWMRCATRRQRSLRDLAGHRLLHGLEILRRRRGAAVELQPSSCALKERLVADLGAERVQRGRSVVIDRA